MSNSNPKRSAMRGWRPAAILASITAVALLAGCSIGSGPGSDDNAGNGASNSSGSTWEDIEERGVINIGVGLTTPPFGLTEKDGDPAGFDTDVAKELADFLGVKANIFEVTADGRIPSIQSGKADVISFTLTNTPERREQIDFSDPVMNTYQGVAVAESSDITSVDDLSGKTISVQKGALGATVAAKAFPDATLQQYDTAVATRLAVAQGQADAIVDSISVLSYALAKEDSSLRIVPGVVGDELQDFALGLQKDNSSLKAKVDAFLEEFHASGKGKELYEKWFGASAPDEVFKGLED
ncbi:substrate-binding periplasmic protein [Paramicrobacterium agarici]|uniref:Amino acid ABC transporter substrate-binding protein (PAAT family) n=1 Tax=Paramicrobacterium agarici TaxID=630514 RepID=A0A2A9DU60_9MICO|nr:transporter substrate-binding domain-containing protein [Microbacterium agarici]PFG29911.1 amino acid ABC transporter substrate-binding protein (PAAT family) [Microbacterium agarici]